MDISHMKHFQDASDIVDALCNRTQNYEKGFFRNLVNYNLCKVASMMRTSVDFPGRGSIPVNFYGISLAPSGFAKGHSSNIMEDEVMSDFITYFTEQTFRELAAARIDVLAARRAQNKGTDPEDERAKLETDFNSSGEILTQFDEATVPAIKQNRRKLQIADAGSLNFIVDEIGANLIKSQDVLTAFLELYDVGKIKEKLVKNTAENVRGEQMTGRTPANMMLYGTPVKLLDGGASEKLYDSFLDMGYARRSFFCYIERHTLTPLSVEQRIAMLTQSKADVAFSRASQKLLQLADSSQHGRTLRMADDVFRTLIEYQVWCEQRADKLPEHDDMSKAEMIHRYFKCVKLAGAFAFYDGAMQIEMVHLEGAIRDTEESGEAFKRMRNRERDYVRLAKYIASTDRQVTHVDISEDLAFYPAAGGAKRNDLINLAMAWAHKNGVVIKKHFVDSIEMFSGSMLEKTDLDACILSHGVGLAEGYVNELAPWREMDKLLLLDNYNWVNHHLVDGWRNENNIAQGFNLVVLDVDGGTPIQTTETLLKDFEYIICTTKSHTESDPHYRIILPLSHKLVMDKEEYSQFMENIYEWFPIPLDTGTKDRSRKWATNASGIFKANTGNLLDALMFIPKTKKNEQVKEQAKELKNLDSMERWFITNTGDGNRNNNLLRYAFLLIDSGKDLFDVQEAVKALNSKMADSLSEAELSQTIFKSASKRYQQKAAT